MPPIPRHACTTQYVSWSRLNPAKVNRSNIAVGRSGSGSCPSGYPQDGKLVLIRAGYCGGVSRPQVQWRWEFESSTEPKDHEPTERWGLMVAGSLLRQRDKLRITTGTWNTVGLSHHVVSQSSATGSNPNNTKIDTTWSHTGNAMWSSVLEFPTFRITLDERRLSCTLLLILPPSKGCARQV